jgi:hypothetical protein
MFVQFRNSLKQSPPLPPLSLQACNGGQISEMAILLQQKHEIRSSLRQKLFVCQGAAAADG